MHTHQFHYRHLPLPPRMNSQGGLTEAQLEDLGTKGKAGLGEALGPLVVSLANEYKEVIRSFVEPWPIINR